jgi:drug/metabolite transporter (DMT)-like permease
VTGHVEWGVAAYGLAAAASWGGGDFSGGIAARRTDVSAVAAVSRAIGCGVQIVLALALGDPWAAPRQLAWAVAAGLSGGIGLVALYRALAVGRMGINAPVTGVVAAAFPVLFGAFTLGLPTLPRAAGFALALWGVWRLARPEGPGGRPEGIGLALLAGLGFGGFYVLISQAHGVSLFWPLAVSTGTSLVLLIVLAAVTRQRVIPGPAALPIALAAGGLDAGGNIFFVLAAHAGRLDVAAVLSSLYPVVTVLGARVILKERVSPGQAVGITAALAAIPLIAG